MKDEAFPSLWRSSDAASNACQGRFLLLVRSHLVLLGLTGTLAAWVPDKENLKEEHFISWSVAIMMMGALAMSIAIKELKLDDAWFRARAFAENAKEAAWRFMMRPATGQPMETDPGCGQFLEELEQIRKRFSGVVKAIALHSATGPEITPQMMAVRAGTLAERIAIYNNDRVKNQIEWYTRKAMMNAAGETRWYIVILACEVVAVIFAFIRANVVHPFNPTGGVVAISACCVAWLQTKRFSDLANTYSVAAVDLRLIEQRFGNVTTEQGLLNLVDEAEKAISREHQLWVERRAG